MNETGKKYPPRYARWFCLEEIEGDLMGIFIEKGKHNPEGIEIIMPPLPDRQAFGVR